MALRARFVITILAVCCVTQYHCEQHKVTDQIYMDIKISENDTGRIVFGLFGEAVPKTVRNFKELALKGINGKTYVGTNFLIALEKVMILGGDILNNNGTGSISIYGKQFEDENFLISHNGSGLLAMANAGAPDTNGCMFFINTMPTPWLHGKNVVFGKVLQGHGIVHKIEHLKTNANNRLVQNVQIIKCGEIETSAFYEEIKDYEVTLWGWLKAGWFPLSFSFSILAFFHYILLKLNRLQKLEKLE